MICTLSFEIIFSYSNFVAMSKPILLYTSIWAEESEDITNQILEAPENESIEIWMNSPGGSVTSGWAIIAALQNRETNITVVGDASSMAFIILLFSDNVTAYDSANFLIHRAASWWEDVMNEDELKDIENRNKVIRKKLEARIDEEKFEKVTGKTFDDIFDMENRLNVRLTAKDAKKIGLVDKVIKLDVRKRTEIESRYFNDIAALASPNKQNNNNSNSNKMGKSIKEIIFGDKDPILLASIGETQFAYGKLEIGSKIKATGKDEKDPISGTFEAEEKQITVVDNEITAINELDKKQVQLDKLSEQVTALSEVISKIGEKEPEKEIKEDKNQKEIDALTKQVTDLTAVLEKAKITASKPDLPAGEFKDDSVKDEELTMREKLALEQKEMHDKKLKSRDA